VQVVATGRLFKEGILVKSGDALERLAEVDAVVFDKTGTLTKGELSLTQVIPFDNCNLSTDQLMGMAAVLEAQSEHPIAKAFSLISHKMVAKDVKNHLGMGIEGVIGQQVLHIGRPDFAFPSTEVIPPEADGKWLLLADSQQPLCWFRITDSLRPEAATTIQCLKQMGKCVTLLSGDTESIVAATAQALGIERWESESKPNDKLSYIQALQAKGHKILMIGDGINDVPVLAGADISMAMGNSSDLARTSADAVLISGNLTRLADAFSLTHRTRRIIGQNLAWALGYNLAALPLAAAGMIAPWMAATGMALSSLIVIANALRLNKSIKLSDIENQYRHSESLHKEATV
ncbi:MAG: heavy metal translocating P-type ATPase, partial [Endozoicomonas sp.]